jgi:hypothetical protein
MFCVGVKSPLENSANLAVWLITRSKALPWDEILEALPPLSRQSLETCVPSQSLGTRDYTKNV